MGAERRGHLDCTAGVAGDMLLGALLGAGASLPAVRAAVRSLGVAGLDVDVEAVRRAGFAATRAVVRVPAEEPVHRRLDDVLALVGRAELPAAGAAFAAAVFDLLADAEAAVHGTTRDEVHFHEVGALDALADVVGCAAALADVDLLGGRVTCSALAAGSGTVRSAHGPLPVPAPAVLEIARRAGLVLAGGELAGERTTPTGAALVAVAAAPGPALPVAVRAVGAGAGSRDTPDRPNLTRLVLGDAPASAAPARDEVLVVESTVDDLDPRVWPSVLAALRAAGAWDCWTTATTGRHGRPGRVVTAVCPPHGRDAVVEALFAHTGTLGVRWSGWQRAVLPRSTATVTVGGHAIGVKLSESDRGGRSATVELADAERAAAALGRPLRAVLDEARLAGLDEARARAAGAGHPVG